MFKKSINTKITGTFLLAVALSMGSCEKFTELDPLADLGESATFSTPANIEATVNGMYWRAAVGNYAGGGGRGYPFGAASAEQGDMRGEDMVNLQAFYRITYTNTYTPNTANNVNHWEQLYALVNSCNVIIEGVAGAASAGVLDAATANAYKGEALFLRALAHHELLVHFCRPYADSPTTNLGVPYRKIAVTEGSDIPKGIPQQRGTVAETYTELLKDLDEAESLLPDKRSDAGLHISRATKGAAIALKTRVKLHQADYAGVIAEATKLGADATSGSFASPLGGYELEADPATPFLNYTKNKESIFSIALSDKAGASVNGAITNMYGPAELGARDLIAISPNLYNASFWLATDKRKTELTYKQSTGVRPFVYAYKYRKYGAAIDDWNPIVRYAEVLLNAAEAYAYNGDNAQALRLLNAVRDRSVAPSDSFGSTPPADLKLAIYNERRIEFIAEGRRWADIHRLALDATYGTNGIPAKVQPGQLSSAVYDGVTSLTPSQGAVPYANRLFLWPIPQSELDANSTLREQQNPGW